MAKNEEKENSRFKVVNVATETQATIMDNSTEETLDLYTALAKILNNQEKLMKLLD